MWSIQGRETSQLISVKGLWMRNASTIFTRTSQRCTCESMTRPRIAETKSNMCVWCVTSQHQYLRIQIYAVYLYIYTHEASPKAGIGDWSGLSATANITLSRFSLIRNAFDLVLLVFNIDTEDVSHYCICWVNWTHCCCPVRVRGVHFTNKCVHIHRQHRYIWLPLYI